MPKKDGKVKNTARRFAFLGPKCVCSFCGENLPVREGATLEEVTDAAPVLEDQVLNILSAYMQAEALTVEKVVWKWNEAAQVSTPYDVSYRRAKCECGEVASSLFWVELEEGLITGPWCGACFANQEFKIWQHKPVNVRVWAISTSEFSRWLDKRFKEGTIDTTEKAVPVEAEDDSEEDLQLF